MASEFLSRRQGVLVGDDGFVHVCEVHTESQSAPLLLSYHQVRHPWRGVDRLDDVCPHQALQLGLHCIAESQRNAP